VVLPKRNEKNLLEDVPGAVRDVMTVRLAESVEDVLEAALEQPQGTPLATAAAA
jgi:ATP-dependent Lon protease